MYLLRLPAMAAFVGIITPAEESVLLQPGKPFVLIMTGLYPFVAVCITGAFPLQDISRLFAACDSIHLFRVQFLRVRFVGFHPRYLLHLFLFIRPACSFFLSDGAVLLSTHVYTQSPDRVAARRFFSQPSHSSRKRCGNRSGRSWKAE